MATYALRNTLAHLGGHIGRLADCVGRKDPKSGIRRFWAGVAVAACCIGALALVATSAASAAETTAPYVVVLKDTPSVEAALTKLEASDNVKAKLLYSTALKGFSANLSPTQVTTLRSRAAVQSVVPDGPMNAMGLTSLIAGESLPFNIRRVAAATTTQVHQAANANVAVLDTGIDLANADLNAVSGTNCITPGASTQDDNGHGTSVAGTIGAKDTGKTVVGVAPGTKVYSVKVLDKNNNGTTSSILCGINWVAANAAALNIKVANMSIAGGGSNDNNCGKTNNDAIHTAVCAVVSAGVTFVAAAGNSKTNFSTSIPAAYPEVLTVTAMTDTDGIIGGKGPAPCIAGEKDDSYATYSNYAVSTADQNHTVAAPGTCVVSDNIGGGTSTYYGTSQAAPAVAGAVALCLGNGGTSGPCSTLSQAGIIQKIRTDAAAGATSSIGFNGDPKRPLAGKYFGYLVNAGGY